MIDLYNADSRSIDAQVLMYLTDVPIVLDKESYLMSFNMLEELGSDSAANVSGEVSANSLDLKLFNDNGIFSPSNTASIYYGLMKAGVKAVVQIRPDSEAAWDDLGTFYVSDWYAEVTSLCASVTCYDRLKDALNLARTTYIKSGSTFIEAFDDILTSAALPRDIDQSIAGTLDWWYGLTPISKTLRGLAGASLSAIFCDRHDKVNVLNLQSVKSVIATVTDDDQIISATVPQSINRDYDGITLTLNNTQLSDVTTVLDIKKLDVAAGSTKLTGMMFSNPSVVILDEIQLASSNQLVKPGLVSYTPSDMALDVVNTDVLPATCALAVQGRHIEVTKVVHASYGTNALSVDNAYIQNGDAATRVAESLNKFVVNNLPFLELSIRGNPSYTLGSKITAISSKYNILFTGIVKRATYTYDGSLKCTLVLLDSRILEVS